MAFALSGYDVNRGFLRTCGFALLILLHVPVWADDWAVVLMYHRFGEDRYPETSIRIEQFEAQLEVLKNEGYAVLPLSSLLEFLKGEASLPPNSVLITIDDAYRSVYEIAYPRLRRYGFPFTVFVATDPVDSGSPAFMTWTQMKEMLDNGASFANHGASHLSMITKLKSESDDDRVNRALDDFERGRNRLSEMLTVLPYVFAYPYGEFDSKIANKLQNMGNVCFGQHSGAVGLGSDLRALPRFPIAEAYSDIGEFRAKLKSLPMPVEDVIPWDPIVTENRPEIDVTLGETTARLAELSCFVGGQGRVPVVWIEAEKRFRVAPQRPLGSGRNRVNCTAPLSNGRYLWFSHPWFVESSDPWRR